VKGGSTLLPPKEAFMTDAPAVPTTRSSASDTGSGPWLDAERLVVYRVALEFLALVPRLVPARGAADIRDQLERASSSVVLNIAEAAGRFSGPDKARFLAIARGSATECAAVLDVLRVRGLASPRECLSARALLVRIVQMLTKLAARQAG
jgi:four helix bundle protein